jgi:hypothetical protein
MSKGISGCHFWDRRFLLAKTVAQHPKMNRAHTHTHTHNKKDQPTMTLQNKSNPPHCKQCNLGNLFMHNIHGMDWNYCGQF